MFSEPLNLEKPGLFITSTDTGVGKTVLTCAVAACLAKTMRIGLCKPLASGCREEPDDRARRAVVETRGSQTAHDTSALDCEDIVALSQFANTNCSVDVINPIRFAEPLAPAVAAQQLNVAIDFDRIACSLTMLDRENDGLLIEGVGGLMVPIDPNDPQCTVLDLVRAIGYPALVVTRDRLGTLNHTAMTVRLLRESGCRVAGLVVNRGATGIEQDDKCGDRSVLTNHQWLEHMTGVPVRATLPRAAPGTMALQEGRMAPVIGDAVAECYWPDLLCEAVVCR